MKKNSEFENILDDCLERLAKGKTLEWCLQHYPEQAKQLKPLLQMAQATRKASAIQPRPEFKARARYEFHSALQTAASKKKVSLFSLIPQWAMALAIVGVLLVSGGGTALAASNSMPDSPLHWVKLATEQVQLKLTPSDIGKARLSAALADRRVKEIIYMADKGDAQELEAITQRLENSLTTLALLASPHKEVGTPRLLEEAPAAAPPKQAESGDDKDTPVRNNNRKLRTTLAHYAQSHPNALRAALKKAPQSVKPGLHQAIDVLEEGYEKALAALD